MSYGANLPDQFRRTGDYVDKILRGTKPADIPVEQPTRFDLVVNLITAKTLGLAWTNSPRSPRTGGTHRGPLDQHARRGTRAD